MKVFITWSGSTSLRVAEWLRDWLPDVLPYIEPWLSEEDISKGTRWSPELWESLKTSKFGIICLVPGIADQPWILFESGALACAQAEDNVAPFLVGLEIRDLPAPLRMFQCVKAERLDVLRLVKSINDASGKDRLTADAVEDRFRRCWPYLRQRLRRISVSPTPPDQHAAEAPDPEVSQDEPKPKLDALAAAILVFLANSLYPNESASGIQLHIGRSERLIELKLKDLQQWDLVEPATTNYGAPGFRITDRGLRILDELGLVK